MCGIAGIVAPAAHRYCDAIERMVTAIKHRGPDGCGTHIFPNCALGHTRLAVIDVEHGAQPMLDPDSGTGITFSGEIYGFQELRAGLNYRFRNESDTEIILALYARHRSRLFEHLPGMFAMALWDERRQELTCGRDRFGERPFFWALGPEGEFVFASEIKAIAASGLVRPVLDRTGIVHILRRGYSHPSRTVFSNIHTLSPAHTLRFRNGQVETERYWQIPEPRSALRLADAVEEFREHFRLAVTRQLVADVEVGAFLSGGADSSSIVAQAAGEGPPLRTYSFGYREESELRFARTVADRWGTIHTEYTEQVDDVGYVVRELAQILDEPLTDSAAVANWLISRFASQDLKVVLGGEGADELLGGYVWWIRRAQRLLNDPDSPERRAHATPLELHRTNVIRFDDSELRKLGIEPIAWDTVDCERSWTPNGTLNDVLRMHVDDWLPGDILAKTDRTSMAHGLELRAPFLDVGLASFCLSLPIEMKVTNKADKLILREACGHLWPEAVRARPKQGFGAPIERWMEQGSIAALAREFLDDPCSPLYDVVDRSGVRASRTHARKSWRLLILALWLEAHPTWSAHG